MDERGSTRSREQQHMNYRLLASTFVLIFLAELGDKTQLAAMARASGGKLPVFIGASLALVCSTLLAVLFGSSLTRLVPEWVIKTASGILFVVFGVLILRSVIVREAEVVESAPSATVGYLARLAIGQAIAFEEAAEADYRKLAQAATGTAAQVLAALASEESSHVAYLRQALLGQEPEAALGTEAPSLPTLTELTHDVANDARPHLEHAAEHEEATARFYGELARVTHLTSLKPVFARLAREETEHAARLRALAAG
jgi:rubrerythrin